MRFMITVKGTPETETSVMPSDALIAPMAVYYQELARAGVLLDATGLPPSSGAGVSGTAAATVNAASSMDLSPRPRN